MSVRVSACVCALTRLVFGCMRGAFGLKNVGYQCELKEWNATKLLQATHTHTQYIVITVHAFFAHAGQIDDMPAHTNTHTHTKSAEDFGVVILIFNATATMRHRAQRDTHRSCSLGTRCERDIYRIRCGVAGVCVCVTECMRMWRIVGCIVRSREIRAAA